MDTSCDCVFVLENASPYVGGLVDSMEKQRIETHIYSCSKCAEGVERVRAVQWLLSTVERPANPSQVAEPVSELVSPPPAAAFAPLSAAPWWAISVALHGLVIALAGLISMAVQLPPSEDILVTVTELLPRQKVQVEEDDKRKPERESPLASKHETPPTDPTSKEFSDIVVPPDILARAELGDHFETINPDRPDTQSAFGNEESKIFHSTTGNSEPEGGGGTGGVAGGEMLIGVGAGGSPGSGGGWGGGNGTGIGVGTGSGRGSFGNRNGGGRKLMVKRHGGNKATEDAVERGLEWLARNQEADGHWDAPRHGGSGGLRYNASMTGLALLAFLGAGHTEKVGKYSGHVKKGIAWLIANQDKSGSWGGCCYTNGIVTMALGEAAGMANIKETREAAQRAIDCVDDAQRQVEGTSEREAWDYTRRGSYNDSSIMSWNILALKSCKVAGLKVNHSAFEGCLRWLDAGQNLGPFKPGQAATDYDWIGGQMIYRGTVANPNQSVGTNAVTAAAALCRLMIGGAKAEDAGVVGPCNIIKRSLVPKAYPFDLYFGYYATLAMFQKGGEHWKVWNEAMKKALVDGQAKGGQDDGSWDPAGAGHVDKCRVMSTALSVLCLEVYYRYIKLNQ